MGRYRYFTYTDITIECTDHMGCDSQYFVGLYDSSESVDWNFGFHPAPGTTSHQGSGGARSSMSMRAILRPMRTL